MPNRTRFWVTAAALLLLSMFENVYATPSMIWSQPQPAGLSKQNGTLIPDKTYVVANEIIALGSAPCQLILAARLLIVQILRKLNPYEPWT